MRSTLVRLPQGGQPLRVRTTETPFERMRGLIGRAPLQAGEAMVLDRCDMVHTIGMRYPIDVVFADRQGVVRKLCAQVPRNRMRARLGARFTVELAAGEAARLGWTVGTRLPFLCAPEAR